MEQGKKSEDTAAEESGMLSRLLSSRMLIVSGAVDGDLVRKTLQQLILLDHADSNKPITMLINSPGGEVYSGFAIFDAMQFIGAPVSTLVVGLAASMGSVIALAATKGRRFCLPHARFLIHQPLLMGYQGRAVELEIQAREMLLERERIVKLYAEYTGRKKEDIIRDIDRDHWMTAEEALDYGLVDAIIHSKADLPQ